MNSVITEHAWAMIFLSDPITHRHICATVYYFSNNMPLNGCFLQWCIAYVIGFSPSACLSTTMLASGGNAIPEYRNSKEYFSYGKINVYGGGSTSIIQSNISPQSCWNLLFFKNIKLSSLSLSTVFIIMRCIFLCVTAPTLQITPEGFLGEAL